MAENSESSLSSARANYIYAILSMALALFLLGFFGLLSLQSRNLIKGFREGINILVELKDGASTDEIAALQRKLNETSFVKPGSVQFTSRDEAARIMSEEMGEEVLKLDLPNPFFDILQFNVRSEYIETDSLAGIRRTLLQQPQIQDVYYQENFFKQVAVNIGKLNWIVAVVTILTVLATGFLIHNTIRLSLFANRFMIKNMELVGATWEFISRPYILRAIRHGLLGACIAIAGLMGLISWISSKAPELDPAATMGGMIWLFAGLALLGAAISGFSTFLVVKKYLKMRVDDLY